LLAGDYADGWVIAIVVFGPGGEVGSGAVVGAKGVATGED